MALKKQDIKEMTNDEIVDKISELKGQFQKMKFNHAVSPLDNPLVLKFMRRDIARLLTEMNVRTQAEASA